MVTEMPPVAEVGEKHRRNPGQGQATVLRDHYEVLRCENIPAPKSLPALATVIPASVSPLGQG